MKKQISSLVIVIVLMIGIVPHVSYSSNITNHTYTYNSYTIYYEIYNSWPDIEFAASRGNENAINYISTNAKILEIFLRKLLNTGYDFIIIAAAGNGNITNNILWHNSNPPA